MNTTWTTRLSALALTIAGLSIVGGCATARTSNEPPPAAMGFLSTYRNLEPHSATSLRYLDPTNRLSRYTKFIVHPVEIMQYSPSDATDKELREIQTYMYDAIVGALSQRYQVVSTPTGETAEIRIAITNVRKSAPFLNVIPRPKITDLGLGGLSMEGEVLDSVSSVQIAALIESATGQNRSINFTTLDDTEAVMDVWAKRFLGTVDFAHGYTGK